MCLMWVCFPLINCWANTYSNSSSWYRNWLWWRRVYYLWCVWMQDLGIWIWIWVIEIQILCFDSLQRVNDLDLTNPLGILNLKILEFWIWNNFLIQRILEMHMTYLNIFRFRIKAFQVQIQVSKRNHSVFGHRQCKLKTLRRLKNTYKWIIPILSPFPSRHYDGCDLTKIYSY